MPNPFEVLFFTVFVLGLCFTSAVGFLHLMGYDIHKKKWNKKPPAQAQGGK
jgi:hypothetical protein